MKYLLILSLVCSLPAVAEDNDLQKQGLKGKVKAVKETRSLNYEMNGEQRQSTSLMSFEFDKAGRMIRLKISSAIDTLAFDEMTTYKYEGRFLKEEEKTYAYANNNRRTTYSYDKQGRLIKETTVPTGDVTKPVTTIKYTYSAEGKIYEKTTFSDEGGMKDKEMEKIQHKYNDAGLLLATFYYDYDTKKFWRDCGYTYNVAGNIIATEKYLPDGGVWNKEVRELNEDGEIVKTLTYNYDGKEKELITRYDKKDPKGNYLFSESDQTKMEREIEYY